MHADVAKVIEALRPAIQADDGDVLLRRVDDKTGVVTVELLGGCEGCTASTEPLRLGVQRILMDRVEGVTAVVQPDPAPGVSPPDCQGHAAASDGTAVSL